MLRRARAWRVIGLALLAWPLAGAAHKSSDAYLFIDSQGGRSTLRWDIALRDLDAVMPLDANDDRQLTWGEVQAAWPRIDALALASLRVAGCDWRIDGHALERRNDGAYAVIKAAADCRISAQTALHYALFADVDPTHRGLVRLTVDGGAPQPRMLVPARLPALALVNPATAAAASAAPRPAQAGAANPAAAQTNSASGVAAAGLAAATAAAGAAAVPPPAADGHAPASFLGEGIHHLVTGYDHLLFLLCLLLPAVLMRQGGRWQPVAGWREAVWPVTKTVTLFTLAHSVTLTLASLGWVRLSSSVVEPAIALTIMLAAFDNLRPLLLRWRGWLTFGFGLIHGFGFAGVLGELDLPTAQFGWALFQFNLGLEIGQLAVVALVVPLLLALRARPLYVPVVLCSGSAVALLVAAAWFVERTAQVRLLPF